MKGCSQESRRHVQRLKGGQGSSIFNKLLFLIKVFEIIVDSRAVLRNNSEKAPVPFAQFPQWKRLAKL